MSPRIPRSGRSGGSTNRVRRGLDLLFAAEVAREIRRAVDAEELERGEPIHRVVDADRLGTALGQPVGRLVAQGALRGVAGGGVTGVIVREVAGRAGARACRTVLERSEMESQLEALDPTTRRRTGAERVDIEVTEE